MIWQGNATNKYALPYTALYGRALVSQRLEGGHSDFKPRAGQGLRCRESNCAYEKTPHKQIPGPPGWGFCDRLVTHPCENFEKLTSQKKKTEWI